MSLPPEEAIRRRVKMELRKRLRGLRNTAPASACAERSEKIRDRLIALDAIARARAVALFWPIEEKHEVDLRPLHARLHVAGVRIAYPSIDPETRVMTFRFVDDVATLEERGLGFSEPRPDAREADALDAIVVPAIALDPAGQRIGYGAGFYDRTLARFAPPAVKIGVAYDYQFVAEIPAEEHDVKMDYVVTDARVERC